MSRLPDNYGYFTPFFIHSQSPIALVTFCANLFFSFSITVNGSKFGLLQHRTFRCQFIQIVYVILKEIMTSVFGHLFSLVKLAGLGDGQGTISLKHLGGKTIPKVVYFVLKEELLNKYSISAWAKEIVFMPQGRLNRSIYWSIA